MEQIKFFQEYDCDETNKLKKLQEKINKWLEKNYDLITVINRNMAYHDTDIVISISYTINKITL